MSRSRVLQVLGGVAVVGGGYYLYTAGGDPKVAQKNLEREFTQLDLKYKYMNDDYL